MPARKTVTDPLWSPAQAAEVLGVCDRTIRNKIARGELTGYKIAGSRSIRVRSADVLGLLEQIPTRRGKQR